MHQVFYDRHFFFINDRKESESLPMPLQEEASYIVKVYLPQAPPGTLQFSTAS